MTQTEATRNSADQEVADAKTPRRALRVNGAAKFQAPLEGSLVINHQEAFALICAAEETYSQHTGVVKEELQAIVSHWLQSPKDSPILLDESFRDRWLDLLHSQCLLTSRNAASGLPEEDSQPRPVHIDFSDIPFPPVEEPKFRFIDLFAGIGGFRQALHAAGGKCIFSSEWEVHAKETYYQNYGEVPFGDITHFTEDSNSKEFFKDSIPSHDVLAAGFPCQPFSQAGLQLGFSDARGTLFFEILKIAKKLRPSILILENVKRLKTHDKGRTFRVIVNSLHEIGYKVYAKILRAYDYGLPQNRERIFIVAFETPVHFEFPSPIRETKIRKVGDILEDNVDDYYTISDRMLAGHMRRLREHKEKGNGFGFSVFSPDAKYTNTISARYWKDGSEILIEQHGKNPRLLTQRECARLQGFPEEFCYNKSRRYAYQQFGNSVPVNVVKAVVDAALMWQKAKQPVMALLDPTEPVIY